MSTPDQLSSHADWPGAIHLATRPTGSPPDFSLSEREQDILLMSALGLCNKSIARRMNVSVRTIESCRAILREKLGTCTVTRLEAMARIILHGDRERLADLLGIDTATLDRRRLALCQVLN